MKKMKLDKEMSKRISSLVMAGALFISAGGCTTKQNNENINNPNAIVSVDGENETLNEEIAVVKESYEYAKEGIKELFSTMNEDVVNNAAMIILLDEFAMEDENGKITADVISNFKSKIDSDNMMADFNSFLDTLEQAMIEEEKIIEVSDFILQSDKDILSKIEELTSNIIDGNKDDIESNFNKIYTLFVKEDEITMDGVTFEIRELSYAGRAIAQAYARTASYYSRNYINENKLKRIDNRTNNQNNKAYIKTKLEILNNQMVEKSEIDVIAVFDNKYLYVNQLFDNKVNLEENVIKNLVNYVNMEYLNSDKVSTEDKETVLGSFEEEEVSDTLLAIDAISKYNRKNQDDIILFSNLLIDNYKNTSTGKIDKIALDFVQYNSIMLINTVEENSDFNVVFNNPYFQNIYKYFTKQNFTHKVKSEDGGIEEIDINWQDISNGANIISNKIILNTLQKLPKVDYMDSYIEKANSNLEESIQYIQNTITGECEKVEVEEFIKIKQ